jgi:predicted GNAT family N-acyltransferase
VPAGTVRLRSVSDTTVKLERLAVLSSFRNLSIASALIEYCTISARHQDYKTIKLHAQKDALTLYIKAGFQIVGEEFYEANIAHIKVEKAL